MVDHLPPSRNVTPRYPLLPRAEGWCKVGDISTLQFGSHELLPPATLMSKIQKVLLHVPLNCPVFGLQMLLWFEEERMPCRAQEVPN